MNDAQLLHALLATPEPERLRALHDLSEEQAREFAHHWRLWARRDQLPPPGDWRTWLILAGRGFGKTRAGAEWVRHIAATDPAARIALVAASLGEARAVMVEGESGVLEVSPPRSRPLFEPSLRRLVWPNGAQAMLYSAQEPESLRGPQHSHACWPGPEGRLCKRGLVTDRCAAALRDRSASSQPARQSSQWSVLARNQRINRGLGGKIWPDCRLRVGQLVVPRAARRHAPAQPRNRAGNAS